MADELKRSKKQELGSAESVPEKKDQDDIGQAPAGSRSAGKASKPDAASGKAVERDAEPGAEKAGARRGKGPRSETAAADDAESGAGTDNADKSEAGADKETSEISPKAKRARSKVAKHVPSGIAHINATFNNTLVTITDRKGAVIAWSSAGRLGFAGTKKSTAYAATMVAQDAARQAAVCRLHEVEVRVQGPGSGRESAIRALQSAGLTITAILDVTPIPHNGCRARKRRRV